MRKSFYVVAGVVIFGLFLLGQQAEEEPKPVGNPSVSAIPENQALIDRLAYLERVDEVAWVEFVRNNVYIGFRSRPADLAAVVNSAAILGNEAHGLGVHVWAVDGRYAGWRPGDGPYYCEATARHGKLSDKCDT